MSYNLVLSFLGIVSVTVVYNPFIYLFVSVLFLNSINGVLLYEFICNFLPFPQLYDPDTLPPSCITLIHSLSLLHGILLYEYFPTYLLSVIKQLCCFQFSFAIINNAAMNTLYRSVGALAYILSLR